MIETFDSSHEETTDRQHSIDNLQDTLLMAVERCVKESRHEDAQSIIEEYVLDYDELDDPVDYLFLADLTTNE